MKSTVETVNPTRAKLSVEVPFSELQPSLEAAYREIAKQVNVPGFRKGKVPPAVIDRQVGRGAVLDQAINESLPQLYVEALKENELEPLGQPEVEVTKLEDGDVFAFTAEVDVKPQITLPSYDGIEASVEDAQVTDADVEEQLQALRERFATLNDVEREAQDGDFVSIDLKATRDGEDVEGGELNGYSYQVGKGDMLPGIDEALRGMKAGDEKSFTSTLLGGDLEGQDVDVTVKVAGVKEQELPELDEEFAQTASEFDTMDELTDDVRTRLLRGKRLEQAAEARDSVLEKLLDATEIPLPEELVSSELAQRRAEVEQQLQWAGMSMQDYLDNEKQTQDEFEAELEKRVRDSVAAQFILDEVAKAEQIGVEQEELSEHLWRRAQQSGQNPQEFVQHMVEHNHLPEMVAEVVRGKALAHIVESAKITDASGNPVELKTLQPDGSYAEETPEASAGSESDGSASAESTDQDAEASTAE